MAFSFEATRTTNVSKNGAILPQKIKELSLKHLGKEIALLGHHPAYLEALQKLEQFAPSEAPVLITGETGVGKELFAGVLYLLSQRKDAAYVPVNCGQFNDEHLMVSELFGHTKGSFTGATHDRQGVFESASGGTVFLDEIGELSNCAQKMLLRVIDQKEIMPLGSTKIRRVDIRVISATHRHLESMAEAGKFREDLFYRLSCLHLHIPALRERGDDRVLLLTYYLDQLNEAHGMQKQFSSKLQHRRKSDLLPLDIAGYYSRMVDKGESFWQVIHEPFLNRDLNRHQVKAILQQGLKETDSYKGLVKLFNIAEADYKNFFNFLQQHNLKS